jgi:hypothetical protein
VNGPGNVLRHRLPLIVALAYLTAPAPGKAQSAEKLFDTRNVLELRIATDLTSLMRERDSTKVQEQPASLSYVASDGRRVTANALVRLRGHWRRQRKNCDFAPISLDFPEGARKGTIFADQGRLKLVTHCRSRDSDYEQFVLREYAVYPLVQLLTPISLRARLVRATYVDSSGNTVRDSLVRNAFFIENERRAAERYNAEVLDVAGASWDAVGPDETATVSLFEYMIGGTDWSLTMLHNVVLYQDKKTQAIWPMAYDFDWTGIVNTKYSFPDAKLGLKSIQDRRYRGICRSEAQWAPIVAMFQAKKAAVYAVYDSVPHLDPKYIRETKKYLDEFYGVLDDPRKFKREMVSSCIGRS